MGKEANLLDAARTGNLQVLSKYITKAKAGSTRAKPHKKLSFFTLHQAGHPHRRRSTGMNRTSGGLDCCDLNGETPLHLATLNSHRAAVVLLMNGGAQVNIRDSQGCLPIHLAAWTGNVDICQSLLQAPTEINVQNKAGDTPLHIASQYGHTPVVRLLLKNGANPMIRNIRGESSLDLSALYGRLETVSLLINDQPALLQQMQHSHSPLHLAARNGQKDVVRKLLQSGYNINARTMAGSALHEAATYGKVAVMKLLVHSGIDTAIKDNNNQTAEEMLESHGSAVSRGLLAAIRGEENLYHSLNEPTNPVIAAGISTPRHRLCKHGKIVREDTKHSRTRERSSSGQTSGSGSSPPISPPPARPDESVQLFRHHSEQADHRSYQVSSDERSSAAMTTRSPKPINQGCVSDNLQRRCVNGHHGQSRQSPTPLHTQHSSTELSHGRHTSCSSHMPKTSCSTHTPKTSCSTYTPKTSCSAHMSKTRKYSEHHLDSQDKPLPERERHKSDSDYIKLSETTTFAISSSHVYKQMKTPPGDHNDTKRDNSFSLSDITKSPTAHPADSNHDNADNTSSLSDTPIYESPPTPFPVDNNYDNMDNISSLSDTPIYDSPPTPCPVNNEKRVTESQEFYPISPSFNSSANTSTIDVFSVESQDSVYNSQGSLSAEGSGTCERRGLGHIYVNLSTYRSTPDLLKLASLKPPRKPPRTPDTESEYCKASDYVGVDINSAHLSRSQDIFSSNTSDEHAVYVVPGDNGVGRRFVFPPLAKSESYNDVNDNDVHNYENMPALVESQLPRSRSPPKAMPRKSKSKEAAQRNNNNYENITDTGSVTGSSVYSCSSTATVEEESSFQNSSLNSVDSTHL